MPQRTWVRPARVVVAGTRLSCALISLNFPCQYAPISTYYFTDPYVLCQSKFVTVSNPLKFQLSRQHLDGVNLSIIFNSLELNSNGSRTVGVDHKLFNNRFVCCPCGGQNIKTAQDYLTIQGYIKGALSWLCPIGLCKMQTYSVRCARCKMRNGIETVTNTGRLIDTLWCRIADATCINNT